MTRSNQLPREKKPGVLSWLFAFAVGASLLAQAGAIGAFTNAADIGAPPLKGAAVYDAAARTYTITGTGTDIWGQADQYHYVWKEMTGNVIVTATTKFLTDGIAHRKASITFRKSADADSPFIHLAIHGDGMTAVQFRSVKGGNTNTLDFPMDTPGVWKLKVQRQGSTFIFWTAKEGAEFRELGRTTFTIGNPVLVGLGVASHSQTALNTVLFSDVSIEPVAAPPAKD